MKKSALSVGRLCVGACVLLMSALSFADMEDDPIISMLQVDQFEWRMTDGTDLFVWEANAWIGRDLHKLWLKTEGEREGGKTEGAEVQLLYTKAITAFWDLQLGAKRDFQPEPTRSWGVVAFKGLAPYLIEVDASLFVGNSGRLAARLEAEYEYMLSQRWILSPEIELNVYSKDDESTGVGRGLADVELGLRLSYEIRRELAPYIGINWEKKYAKTADFARDEGEDTEDFQALVGLRFWF